MKLTYKLDEICAITRGKLSASVSDTPITSIAYDTRKIANGVGVLFFALSGEFRNGHSFIEQAYSKGVRNFVISENSDLSPFQDALFIQVEDTLTALQDLAHHHRKKFSYPVLAITGSAGKTMVKEWIYHFLSPKFKVIRSPKSFNSQLGVALSLLELNEKVDLAIIEMGISQANEMERLEQITAPSFGIFTSFGSAHRVNFDDMTLHLNEKLKAFINSKKTFIHASIPLTEIELRKCNGIMVENSVVLPFESVIPFSDKSPCTTCH